MVYGYIRVSTDGQTTENQKIIIKNYCKFHRLHRIRWISETVSGIKNPEMFDRVKRAWAVWMLGNCSFGNNFIAGFGYDRAGAATRKLAHKRNEFTETIAIRLQNVQIECCDALRVVRSRDTKDTFFYLDPPYVGSFQGHYDGYDQDDFDKLLALLATIKGNFLLSSFRNDGLSTMVKRYGWYQIELKMAKSMTSQLGKTLQKIEVLTANYPIKLD